MTEGRYPGYDVMAKRHTPSWNEQTRRAIDARLAVHPGPRFFTAAEWATLGAACARIVPQPRTRPPIPVPALIDLKLHAGDADGYRNIGLPPMQKAWRRGLAALDAEARHAYAVAFHRLDAGEQDALLGRAQRGELKDAAWDGMPPDLFFKERLVRDIVHAYYAHPTSWNEIGFGGPASPRGYVRLGFDRRDPWEAAEAKDGGTEIARRENRHVR